MMPQQGARERIILHIDMDAFFVSVEEALDPSLRGKPVVVGGDPDGRGVVAAASYEARAFGIHSAMPIARARRLCPETIFLRGSYSQYSEFSQRIFAILKRYSPSVEPMSLDEAYVDLTGCQKLFGPLLPMAEGIRKEIWDEVGVPASLGIASNKLIAKIASAFCKPRGMLWIAPGMEGRFIQAMPVRRIPGVGAKGEAELRHLGVRTVNDLRRLSESVLENHFGKWGLSLYRKSRGICERPVQNESTLARSISRETTFDVDSNDLEFLRSQLSYLTEKVASQLRAAGLFAACVSVKLRDSKFKTESRSKTLAEATSEDRILFRTASDLLKKLFNDRPLRARLIGVALSSLTEHRDQQFNLFETAAPGQNDRLYEGLDRIRQKYGFRSILRGESSRD
ncbi:MAG: DNA polymerase IV [Candidatus Nitrohelix vancouverensis]|uniref:DNA polymerase IV n=1 Tax=Candidatus Nitrohelix vancouverensis TaxID=2705534 RepID=A0A7T0G270_9BACT|nr:MAG: DNA polymerase IV [Candidatus Nitrohelix vancouverensis]